MPALTSKQWFFVCLLIILIGLFLYNRRKKFCFVHFRVKDLKPYQPGDPTMYCSSCIQEELNPRVDCECGFSGRLVDLDEHSFNEDTLIKYYCPACDKEIRI
jgi:hypothetical protein